MTSMKTLTRKSSVSSLNSYTTQCTQKSYNATTFIQNEPKNSSNKKLLAVLPYWKWSMLMEELRKLDS